MAKSQYSKVVLDARRDRLDLRDREYRPPLISLPASWPREADIAKYFPLYNQMGMVLNQGEEGACTGFGLAGVINFLVWWDAVSQEGDALKKEEIQTRKVSPKMLYNMARIYDEWKGEDYEGSSCRGAMKGWHKHGVCSQKSWPNHKHKTEEYPAKDWAKEAVENPLGVYYRINKDSVVDMQAAIMEVGAIYCSATVHTGWQKIISSDILPTIKQTKRKMGGHAFAIVGYNKEGFIVQNSWGGEWGFHGFAVITYRDWVENSTDAWVAVRGAPLAVERVPITFSNQALQTVGADYSKSENLTISRALGYSYTQERLKPWSEEQAYQHSVVIGNDGRPKRTIVSASTPEESVQIISYRYLKAWMAESKKNRKVVIYAHGGLNNEKDSINRIRIMAPYFKANGIYPLFITWKTGVMESISNQIHDQIGKIFSAVGIASSSTKAHGILQRFQESIDRSIESFSKHIVVKGIWSEIKENAKYASDRAVPGYAQHGDTKSGGMVILAQSLERLQKEFGCEVHLVGHSAGSILFGYWMEELAKRAMLIDSLTLYAPACTVEFANKYYIKAHKKGVIDFLHNQKNDKIS